MFERQPGLGMVGGVLLVGEWLEVSSWLESGWRCRLGWRVVGVVILVGGCLGCLPRWTDVAGVLLGVERFGCPTNKIDQE